MSFLVLAILLLLDTLSFSHLLSFHLFLFELKNLLKNIVIIVGWFLKFFALDLLTLDIKAFFILLILLRHSAINNLLFFINVTL